MWSSIIVYCISLWKIFGCVSLWSVFASVCKGFISSWTFVSCIVQSAGQLKYEGINQTRQIDDADTDTECYEEWSRSRAKQNGWNYLNWALIVGPRPTWDFKPPKHTHTHSTHCRWCTCRSELQMKFTPQPSELLLLLLFKLPPPCSAASFSVTADHTLTHWPRSCSLLLKYSELHWGEETTQGNSLLLSLDCGNHAISISLDLSAASEVDHPIFYSSQTCCKHSE